MKILVVVGTRPEAIKMQPVVWALREQAIGVEICTTGQHPEMLATSLAVFGEKPEYAVAHEPHDGMGVLVSQLLPRLGAVYGQARPDRVLVQGDTSSAFAAALAALYRKIPVGHVEAGLRSGNWAEPFPEETNRILISRIADMHFAPTTRALSCLSNEKVPGRAYLTGNTSVDMVRWFLAQRWTADGIVPVTPEGELVVVTCHRRESWGGRLQALIAGVRELVTREKSVFVVWPVHPNPAVAGPVRSGLREIERVFVIDDLPYPAFLWLLARSELVITDSGGVIEETVTLGRRLIIVRDWLERPEALAAPNVMQMKSDALQSLPFLAGPFMRETPLARGFSFFGDGRAGKTIAALLATEPGGKMPCYG